MSLFVLHSAFCTADLFVFKSVFPSFFVYLSASELSPSVSSTTLPVFPLSSWFAFVFSLQFFDFPQPVPSFFVALLLAFVINLGFLFLLPAGLGVMLLSPGLNPHICQKDFIQLGQ